MLRIKKYNRIRSIEELRVALQNAVELEHATIPPYLYALYSLIPGKNKMIYRLIESVVIEEMLHMTLAANILNAVGGHPDINNPKFIPNYPGPLPLGIGTEDGQPFIVSLEKFSPRVTHDTFMRIEEPEDPIDFDDFLKAAPPEYYHTIGEFYQGIARAIVELNSQSNIFTGSQDLQVTEWYSNEAEGDLIAVTDQDSALAAIQTIVSQGEGSSKSPFDLDGNKPMDLAHYYKFAEIYNGKALIRDPSFPSGFSYSGQDIPYDPDGVYNLLPNSKTENLPQATNAYRLSKQFNEIYTSLLNALHISFNGQPNYIRQSMGLMFSLKVTAMDLVQEIIWPGEDLHPGPSFEYTPV